MSETHLWGITRCYQVFRKKENADYFCKYLNEKFYRTGNHQLKVYEIFTDCYVDKLKRGWKTFAVIMERDGTLISCKEQVIFPTVYGFKSGRINVFGNKKTISYTCLAKDEDHAEYLCNEYRIKTFLDDIWFK